jgi:hypothetical protein
MCDALRLCVLGEPGPRHTHTHILRTHTSPPPPPPRLDLEGGGRVIRNSTGTPYAVPA